VSNFDNTSRICAKKLNIIFQRDVSSRMKLARPTPGYFVLFALVAGQISGFIPVHLKNRPAPRCFIYDWSLYSLGDGKIFYNLPI